MIDSDDLSERRIVLDGYAGTAAPLLIVIEMVRDTDTFLLVFAELAVQLLELLQCLRHHLGAAGLAHVLENARDDDHQQDEEYHNLLLAELVLDLLDLDDELEGVDAVSFLVRLRLCKDIVQERGLLHCRVDLGAVLIAADDPCEFQAQGLVASDVVPRSVADDIIALAGLLE
jgi:hypothetical protein